MPEGYPSKKLQSITIVDGKKVMFQDIGIPNLMSSFQTSTAIIAGDKLTVIWDGESYDITVIEKAPYGLVFGNLSLLGEEGYQSDLPFAGEIKIQNNFYDITLYSNQTEESHTITVILHKVIYTPIDQNFLSPPQNLNVIFTYFNRGGDSGLTGPNNYFCNVTYSQLRDWFDRQVPIFAICKVFSQTGDYEALILSYYKFHPSKSCMVFNFPNYQGTTVQIAYYEDGRVTGWEEEPS